MPHWPVTLYRALPVTYSRLAQTSIPAKYVVAENRNAEQTDGVTRTFGGRMPSSGVAQMDFLPDLDRPVIKYAAAM